MNKTLVASINEQNIYYINDKNVPFYILIPKNNRVSIVLNLVDDVNMIKIENKDISHLSEEIKKIYNKFSFDDIAVVTPIFDSNLLEQIKLNNDGNSFMYLDKFMGYLINTVYSFLKSNNMNVDNIIKFSNNVNYKDFNEWFIKKYGGRVVLVNYVESLDSGSNENNSSGNVIANEALEGAIDFSSNTNEDINRVNNTKEPGFVSYVLLGVIVAVVSLVILYMLL